MFRWQVSVQAIARSWSQLESVLRPVQATMATGAESDEIFNRASPALRNWNYMVILYETRVPTDGPIAFPGLTLAKVA